MMVERVIPNPKKDRKIERTLFLDQQASLLQSTGDGHLQYHIDKNYEAANGNNNNNDIDHLLNAKHYLIAL